MISPAVIATLALVSQAPLYPSPAAAVDAIAGGAEPRVAVEVLRKKGKPGLWMLADQAKKRDGVERARLYEAIGWFGTADAEWPLRKGLKDDGAAVRAGAIRGLGHLRSERVVGALLEAAAAGTEIERSAAVAALAELGAKADGRAKALLTAADPRARASGLAWSALRQDAGDVDAAVIAGLADKSPLVRMAAIELASERGTISRASDLAAAARDGDPAVAKAAVAALGKMWPPDAPRILGGLMAAPELGETVWREAFDALRRAGARGFPGLAAGLVAAPAPRRDALTASLLADVTAEEIGGAVDLLAEGRGDQAEMARSILAAVGGPAEDAAVARLATATPYQREVIVRWLKSRPADAIGKKLIAAARSGEPTARASAIATAASFSGDAVMNEIAELTRDHAAQVRAAALVAIGGFADSRVEAVLEAGLGDPEPKVRAAAVDGLARRRSASRATIAARALEDLDEEVRAAVIAALAGTRDPELIGLLERRLRTAPPPERVPIVKAIAASTHPQAASLMVKLVTDPDPDIRRAALRVVDEQ